MPPVIMELPATAIYYLEWRATPNDPWARWGHVVVNGSDTYKSQNHTYLKGYESWWTTTNLMKDVVNKGTGMQMVVAAVASKLSDLANLIAQLEAQQYASQRFDTKYELSQQSWKKLPKDAQGPVFAGPDSGQQLLVRVGPVLDNQSQLGDFEWYSDQILTGTPYFGGQASQGETITLTRLTPGHNDWPVKGEYVHDSN